MIGQKLGTFVIESELGAGAMGIVYKGVRDSGKTRVAAVKVISTDQLAKGKAFERFIREAEILEGFRHPNIVRYLARGKQGKTFYYAMEFIPGSTLDRLIEEKGPLPWPEVARLGIQICDALHYAHEHSVVHRDLKPSNLMVTEDGVIKLTDFGIAKDLDATALTATGRTLGTAAYMAPEQIRGTPEVSHKTDLYALGIVLYQMLTGDLPFHGASAVVLMHCHMNEPAPLPSAKAPENIPRELDKLVNKLMAKDRNDRPWDAAAVGQTLLELSQAAEKANPVAMVWTEDGSEAHPPRAGAPTVGTTPTAKGAKSKARPRARLRDGEEDERSPLVRALPTIGLLAALGAIGGAIGYLVWPVSATYLHQKAAELMVSTDRTDWVAAESRYLDELDRRFPAHPFKAETDAWRDRNALAAARRRSEVLEGGVAGFKKPENHGEELYLATAPEARSVAGAGDEVAAAARWREMAQSLEGDGTKGLRGWFLLAKERAEEIEAGIARRAAEVARLIEQARSAEARGYPEQAQRLREDMTKRFGKFTDTAEALLPPRPPVEPKAP